MPSAARQSQTARRLCPLTRAVRISGQRARIWAALLGGFFSRRAARRVRAFSLVRLLVIPFTTVYDDFRHFSTAVDMFDNQRRFSTTDMINRQQKGMVGQLGSGSGT